MAGKIVADIIEAPAGRISLNVANVTVASINASGVFSSTGNLLITQAGTIGTGAITDGAVTNAKLNLVANASNIKTALNATGDAPIYACRAWVNFNGTGTVAIRASGNVSSITDNGTGFYTVNFGTAMPDSNYAVLFTPGGQETTSTANLDAPARSTTPTATAVQMFYSNGNQDTLFGSVAIFR